jgi:Spy/CpxP family protein refolding chaperone
MNVRHKVAVFSSLLFFLLASLGQAQRGPVQDRARMRDNLATLRLLRLTQALDLNEKQAAIIFPVFNRIEKEKLDIQMRLAADIRDIRRLIQDPSPDEAEIEDKTKDVREARNLIEGKDRELEAFLESNLTSIQKAKYVLFQVDFYRGLEQNLDRLRMVRGNAPPSVPIKKK